MSASTPICPRCGYDQTGVIASWERVAPAACPLEGVCSECGLEFSWVDVVRPDRVRVRGLFEHALGWREWLTWSVRTWLLVLRPWAFWRRVPMTFPPVVGRLILWVVIASLPAYVIGSLLYDAAFLVQVWYWSWRSTPQVGSGLVGGWVMPLGWVGYGARGAGWVLKLDAPLWVGFIGPTVAAWIVWPVLVLVLPVTRRVARVRVVHLLRAGVYSLAWVPLFMFVRVVDAIWDLGQAIQFLQNPRMRWGPSPMDFLRLPWWSPMIVGVVFVWLALWWYYVVVVGFRIQRGAWVWLLLAVAAGLFCATVGIKVEMMRLAYGWR